MRLKVNAIEKSTTLNREWPESLRAIVRRRPSKRLSEASKPHANSSARFANPLRVSSAPHHPEHQPAWQRTSVESGRSKAPVKLY
jgi:hypothetical protein